MSGIDVKWVKAPVGSLVGKLVEVGTSGCLIVGTKDAADVGTGGSGGSVVLKQRTELDLALGDDGQAISTDHPKSLSITIPSQIAYRFLSLSVLKYVAGAQDVAAVECGFAVTDSTKFVSDSKVVFDNTAHLKTSYPITMSTPVALGDGYVSEGTIDLVKSDFVGFFKLEVA